jgi:hypothetical protein
LDVVEKLYLINGGLFDKKKKRKVEMHVRDSFNFGISNKFYLL